MTWVTMLGQVDQGLVEKHLLPSFLLLAADEQDSVRLQVRCLP